MIETRGGAMIVDSHLFTTLVEMETRKAQRMRYTVSVVCLGLDEHAVSATALAQRVAPSIRATDVVAAHGTDSVTMLLVDAEDTNVPAIMNRLTPGLDDVAWSAGGSCYPKTAGTAEDLLNQAEAMMTQARLDGGRRVRLPA